jgi:hypothetical protein
MLRQAWNTYRGWAKLARDMETAMQRWNLAALCLVSAAAVFGAVASVAPELWSAWAASAATLASALGAFLGRQIVGAGNEGAWIQARAVAEGIKSECYRYAARSGAYAVVDADAAKALAARTEKIAKQATDRGLVRADDPAGGTGNKREPPVPLTTDWYKKGRIENQIDYYRRARERNQRAADALGGSPSRRASRQSSSARWAHGRSASGWNQDSGGSEDRPLVVVGGFPFARSAHSLVRPMERWVSRSSCSAG